MISFLHFSFYVTDEVLLGSPKWKGILVKQQYCKSVRLE